MFCFLKNYNKIQTHKKKIVGFYNKFIPDELIYQNDIKDRQIISHYKYITFIKSNKYAVSPVYDKDNQLYSILKFNEVEFEFVGKSISNKSYMSANFSRYGYI